MKKTLSDKGINEMKEGLPNFLSFAGAMANAGRKIKRPTGKRLFYEKDIKEHLKEFIRSVSEYFCVCNLDDSEIIRIAKEEFGEELI